MRKKDPSKKWGNNKRLRPTDKWIDIFKEEHRLTLSDYGLKNRGKSEGIYQNKDFQGMQCYRESNIKCKLTIWHTIFFY